MVISSSPARSNAHSFTAATRSTTSTGFMWRSPRYSMRDMPPPGAGTGSTRERRFAPCAGRHRRGRGAPQSADHRVVHYNCFAPANKNGQVGCVEDSHILEDRAGGGAEGKFLSQSNSL